MDILQKEKRFFEERIYNRLSVVMWREKHVVFLAADGCKIMFQNLATKSPCQLTEYILDHASQYEYPHI